MSETTENPDSYHFFEEWLQRQSETEEDFEEIKQRAKKYAPEMREVMKTLFERKEKE